MQEKPPSPLNSTDGRGRENGLEVGGRLMTTSTKMNHNGGGADGVDPEMLARLSIGETANNTENNNYDMRGMMDGNGRGADEILPSDSLEVQLPNARGAPVDRGPEVNVTSGGSGGLAALGQFGPGAQQVSSSRGGSKGRGNAGREASNALHALQSSAAAAASGPGVSSSKAERIASRTKGPTLPSRSSDFDDKAGSSPGPMDEEDYVEEDEEESSEISASDEDGSWITWFCSLRGNEFFCEVDEDYIQDDFNLTGLNSLVPYYEYALDMVLDVEMPMEDSLTEEQQEIVESAAVS